MPVEFGSVGGIAAAFTVTDEFSDTLTRAEVMLRETAKAADAFSRPAAKWSAAATALGRAATDATPKFYALAAAAREATTAIERTFGRAIESASAMRRSLARSAESLAPFRAASAAALTSWNRIDAAIDRSTGLLDSAGNKMAFAATSSRAMAAEAAEIAAAAQKTAAAAKAASDAESRVRLPRASGGGGGMPPISLPPAATGGGEGGAGRGYGRWGHRPSLRFLTGVGRGAGFEERLFSIPAFAAGYVGYEAFKNAVKTQYSVAVGAEMFDPAAIKNPTLLKADEDKLNALAFRTSIGTIYTAQQTADAYATLAAILATAPPFQGPDKFKNFDAIAPIMLRASEVGTMQHLGTLQENMLAMAFYAHLLGAYTPEAMTAASDQFLAIAERTGQKMPALERNMAYALPLARGLGVSVSDTALVVGALIQGGLGRKSGVAVARILTGLLQTGGPITAALQNALNALGPDAITYKGKRLSPHLAALHALGLLDAKGHLTVTDKAGNIVWSKLIADIDEKAKTLSKQAFADAIYSAFGIRGARAANLLPALGKVVPAFEKSVSDTATAIQQQKAFAQTSQQEFEQMVARLTDIGNILATAILPVMSDMLRVLIPILGDIDSYLGKHHDISTVLSGAAVGAAGGALVAGPAGAGIGALVGGAAAALTIQPQAQAVSHSAHSLAEAIYRHGTGEPIIVRDHSPDSTTINVHAPLTVHVDGSVIDTLGLQGILGSWWNNHKGQIYSTVEDAVGAMQTRQKRRTLNGQIFPGGAYLTP